MANDFLGFALRLANCMDLAATWHACLTRVWHHQHFCWQPVGLLFIYDERYRLVWSLARAANRFSYLLCLPWPKAADTHARDTNQPVQHCIARCHHRLSSGKRHFCTITQLPTAPSMLGASKVASSMKKFLLIILFLSLTFFTLAIASVTQPFVVRTTSITPTVDSKTLEAHVKKLSIAFHPRSYTDKNNLDATASYIESELRAYGINSERQTYTVDGNAYHNIIARFGPVSDDVLVIGAHYDSHGITPGADDNASGVAGLLELARLLSKNPPRQAVELVAYTLEEPPFFRTENMGSAQHAQSLKQAGKNVRLMISIEMIGYFNDTPSSQRYPVDGMTLHYPDTGNFIAIVGKYSDFASMRKIKSLASGATDLPIYSINAPPFLQGIDFSDHQSYWKQGFPAVMVTDTSFYRNQHYHEATDTAEKLDYARMAKAVQAVYSIAQAY
jgi:hypothetical protein